VDECFIHCGAAFRRASVWDTTTWPAGDERPSPAAILKGHAAIDVPAADIQSNLDEYYDKGIWEVGGQSG
jgi:hypothetical protein